VVKISGGGEGILIKTNGKKAFVHYLVLEYVTNGELFDFVYLTQKGFGEDLGRYIFISVLNGLEACHNNGVVHRDLKTENLMLSSDFKIKIADFGFATSNSGDSKGLLYSDKGTPSYSAPEVLRKQPYYGVASDIFSLGVTSFIVVTGSIPFKLAVENDAFYNCIMKGDYDSYWLRRNAQKLKLSKDFQHLFQLMVAFDPSQRPSINEIKKHPWLADYADHTDLFDMKMITQEFQKKKRTR